MVHHLIISPPTLCSPPSIMDSQCRLLTAYKPIMSCDIALYQHRPRTERSHVVDQGFRLKCFCIHGLWHIDFSICSWLCVTQQAESTGSAVLWKHMGQSICVTSVHKSLRLVLSVDLALVTPFSSIFLRPRPMIRHRINSLPTLCSSSGLSEINNRAVALKFPAIRWLCHQVRDINRLHVHFWHRTHHSNHLPRHIVV